MQPLIKTSSPAQVSTSLEGVSYSGKSHSKTFESKTERPGTELMQRSSSNLCCCLLSCVLYMEFTSHHISNRSLVRFSFPTTAAQSRGANGGTRLQKKRLCNVLLWWIASRAIACKSIANLTTLPIYLEQMKRKFCKKLACCQTMDCNPGLHRWTWM